MQMAVLEKIKKICFSYLKYTWFFNCFLIFVLIIVDS